MNFFNRQGAMDFVEELCDAGLRATNASVCATAGKTKIDDMEKIYNIFEEEE